jgi:death-on-curing protein
MRYLSLSEVLVLYRRVIDESGGTPGVRDLGALEAALAQPRQGFGDADLYPTLAEKAAALGFSLIQNHPFLDGNKRTGHVALEVFLLLNGFEIQAPVDEQERVILEVAAGKRNREEFTRWLAAHIVGRESEENE